MSGARATLAAFSLAFMGAGFIVFLCALSAAESVGGAVLAAAGVAGWVKVTR